MAFISKPIHLTRLRPPEKKWDSCTVRTETRVGCADLQSQSQRAGSLNFKSGKEEEAPRRWSMAPARPQLESCVQFSTF